MPPLSSKLRWSCLRSTRCQRNLALQVEYSPHFVEWAAAWPRSATLVHRAQMGNRTWDLLGSLTNKKSRTAAPQAHHSIMLSEN